MFTRRSSRFVSSPSGGRRTGSNSTRGLLSTSLKSAATIGFSISADFAIEVVLLVKCFKTIRSWRLFQCFSLRQAQYSELVQALVKHLMRSLLDGSVKKFQRVAAEDRIELVEGTIGRKVVSRKDHILAQGRIKHTTLASTREILGECRTSPALLINLLVLLELIQREDTIVTILNETFIHVGAVNDALLI